MVKVKQIVKKNASSTKAKATPTKSNTARIRKVRINIKDIKKSQETIPDNTRKSMVRGDLNVSSKSRSLVVNLRRLPTNNTHNKDGNNNKNILQAQCKVVEKNKPELNLESKVGTTPLITPEKRIKTAGDCDLVTRRKGSKVAVKATKTNTESTKRNKINDDPMIAENISKETNGSTLIRSLCNCCVKIRRLTRRVDVKEVQKNKEPSTPSCTKRCVVRVQKTPVKNCNNFSVQQSRKCKIKLHRIPFKQKENKAIERRESKASSQYSAINNAIHILPVVDNLKRNNLKSPTKSNMNEMNDNVNSLKSGVLGYQSNKKVTYEENIAFSKLKHIPKLSLKKTNNKKDNNVSDILEMAQFDPPQNSTIHFEPVRNSTMLELGFNEGINTDNPQEEQINENSKEYTPLKNVSFSSQGLDNILKNTKETTKPKKRSVSQNLANKSDEIENLLNSLDDEENINKGQDKSSPPKTNKFFHYKIGNLKENSLLIDQPKTKPKPFIKKQSINKQRRLPTKRSSLMKRKDIYEFLSQSQTSDSDGGKHLDPAADIIKKLIDQGKVRVATNCKGKGKPVFKRKVPCKQMKKIKQNTGKKWKQLKNNDNVKGISIAAKEIDHQAEKDNHFDDDFDYNVDDDDLMAADVDYDLGNMHENTNKKLKNNNKNEQEGTFSHLARSVLIHQAGRSNFEKKKNLLEMVKKYISTPKSKQSLSETALHPDISPISMPPPARPKTKASPWRVDENANLPRIFNFSRSSANLPSFSSDYIPSTPRKDKSKNSNTNSQQQSCLFNDNSPQSFLPLIENQNSLPLISGESSIPDKLQSENQHKDPSVISSFSSNDSNAENMPPTANIVNEGHNENNNIFDLKQLPNPRRAFTYRSPLKTINILEVVHLPPYICPNKTNAKVSNNDATDMLGFKEHDTVEESSQADQNIENISGSSEKNCGERSKSLVEEDLFGFEEFLSQNSAYSQEYENNDSFTEPPNITIHEKLQDLRRLKPKDNELQLCLAGEKTSYPITLFENEPNSVGVDGMRQKGIKEMLCSTMLHYPQPSTSKYALKELEKRQFWDVNKPNEAYNLDLSDLFKDSEPETTLNENEAHRTYIRPFKRKRRLKENKYVVFLESDESGDEEILKDPQKHNHSNETDTSSENNPKKKRQRKMPKENLELNEFIEEFNKMCKEVDCYELRVEKST